VRKKTAFKMFILELKYRSQAWVWEAAEK